MTLTVGELKEMLNVYTEDTKIDFSGLDFYRLKKRDDKLLQVEFSQTVYKDPDTNEVTIENHNIS
ncbi:hypothetical protein OLL83_002555 [Shewanella algae]|uniref:hypothetical protein n=1 Tax=Shewanella algae TaxID=38313 RepID=UPI002232652C|nr:hypothetical protein [Shewanella algae]UZD56846.1 hypothetical protein OLL83_002555 [Shewanella algae]